VNREILYRAIYSEQDIIIHTYPKEVLDITTWEQEAALIDTKKGTAKGKYHINMFTMEAGENIISKTFVKL